MVAQNPTSLLSLQQRVNEILKSHHLNASSIKINGHLEVLFKSEDLVKIGEVYATIMFQYGKGHTISYCPHLSRHPVGGPTIIIKPN